MAKISDERREERRQQILKAAIACFARKGFRGARMQDICREAKLSPGAVYLYFKSKDAIVRVLAEQAQAASAALWANTAEDGEISGLGRIEKLFDRVCSVSDPTAARMGIQFWAQAFDNAFLNEAMQADHEESVGQIARLLRAEAELGRADAEALSQMVIATLRGFGLQKAIVPTIDLKPAAHAFLNALQRELGDASALQKSPGKFSGKGSKSGGKTPGRGRGGRQS